MIIGSPDRRKKSGDPFQEEELQDLLKVIIIGDDVLIEYV